MRMDPELRMAERQYSGSVHQQEILLMQSQLATEAQPGLIASFF